MPQRSTLNRLLIIDDDVQLLNWIERVARPLGYVVDKATDIDSAIDRLALHPDLILLDLGLGRDDGLALFRAACLIVPATPIMIMSGFDHRVMELAERVGREQGCAMAGILAKPFDTSVLTQCLVRYAKLDRDEAIRQLAAAIGTPSMVAHYQPILDLATARLVGAEALVRWYHPQRGMVSPADIIPLAEETGLIQPLTRAILEQVGIAWASLPKDLPELRVAVNISAHSLRDGNFVADVKDIIRRADIPPGAVVLELTETAAFSDIPNCREILCRLRVTGVGLALDDFGTGYSSLLALRDLPLTELKIDRAFVTGAEDRQELRLIAQSVTELGHSIGLKIVSEGVESHRDLDLMRTLGVDYAQGFLIGRPQPFDEFCSTMRRPAPVPMKFTSGSAAIAFESA